MGPGRPAVDGRRALSSSLSESNSPLPESNSTAPNWFGPVSTTTRVSLCLSAASTSLSRSLSASTKPAPPGSSSKSPARRPAASISTPRCPTAMKRWSESRGTGWGVTRRSRCRSAAPAKVQPLPIARVILRDPCLLILAQGDVAPGLAQRGSDPGGTPAWSSPTGCR